MYISSESLDNKFENFRFYDIEVFKEDTLVVFKTLDGLTEKVFHNDFNELEDYITNKILVGYNNYFYDDFILSALLKGLPQFRVKAINDEIIAGDKPSVKKDDLITSLDCFQQINVANSSLKKVEANLGLSIDESEVPFDIDRRLTEEEYKSVLKYCEHDVFATIQVFKLRWKTYFVPKLNVVDMLDIDQSVAIRWRTTTITAQLLTGGKNIPRWYDYFDFDEYGIELPLEMPLEVIDMWNEVLPSIRIGKEITLPKLSVERFGCTFEFGFGGLHGVNDRKKSFRNVKLLDVASMYPNIIINLNALGQQATEKYKSIVDTRIKAKNSGDKTTAEALKLVINSTYGLMKNRYSRLYNPAGATSICMMGQIALFDLCERLYYAGYELVNINTDGVAFTGYANNPNHTYKDIWSEWERDYNLTLEISEFNKFIQKDVNNYVSETKDGHIKVKGGDVNKFNDPNEYGGDLFSLNAGFSWSGTNTTGIISRAVVDYVLNGVSPEITVKKNIHNPILYQFVLQAGNTYAGTFDENGKEYQKVNRVFASKKDSVTLYKVREDGATTKFANAPDNMLVYNDDLKGFIEFEDIVDIQYYNELARNVCDRWKGL